ncbi:MAG: hypothetical protein GC160_01430 [Acidobacteria bacterium]|nr:hypothetical protein [Acidobacteriota bacterium]
MATKIQNPDDIDTFFHGLALESDGYRSFSRRPPVRSQENEGEDEPASTSLQALAPPVRKDRELASEPAPIDSTGADSFFAAMDNALSRPSAAGPRRRTACLRMYSVAEGAGATSLTANLGRLWAGEGRSVALVDDASDSLLPFYFGVRRQGLRFSSVLVQQGASTGEVQLLARNESEDRVDESGRPWYAGVLGQMGVAADYVLQRAGRPGRETASEGSGISLLLIGAEASSIYKLPAALERLGRQEIRLVLTRFRPELDLHRRLRSWLSERFGDRLAPVTLRWDEAADWALTAGRPVVDYAPSCPLSADYRELGDWLAESPAFRRTAETLA